uniref:C2H2-type domain-containing protein n=1 Tax=Anopheles atroparvus TaxID=41427 RepID=A0A182JLE4_ANOAO
MDEYVECTSLAQMLTYCTKMDIELYDNLPGVLCIKCKDDLCTAYKLIVLYHKTSERWKDLSIRKKIALNVERIDVTPEQGRFCTFDSGGTIFPDVDPIATTRLVEKQRIETTCKRMKTICLPESCSATNVAPGSYNFQLCTRCSTCGAKFMNTRELREHRRSEFESSDDPLVADRKRFVCNICFRRYTSRSILMDHKQRPYRTKLYQCAHCGKAFRDKYSLDDHERTHGDERPFMCDICSKTFAMKESYRKHLRLHTFVPDRFKCDVCGKGFRTNGNLKEHHVTHSVVKSLQCPQCSSQFTRKSCLKSHMRLHTGEKPYKCELCDAVFTFPSDLRRHVMAHKGIKPFSCDICNKAYNRKDYLAKHLTSSHPDETEMKPSIAKETQTEPHLSTSRKIKVQRT